VTHVRLPPPFSSIYRPQGLQGGRWWSDAGVDHFGPLEKSAFILFLTLNSKLKSNAHWLRRALHTLVQHPPPLVFVSILPFSSCVFTPQEKKE
jgi:hypothetical protein